MDQQIIPRDELPTLELEAVAAAPPEEDPAPDEDVPPAPAADDLPAGDAPTAAAGAVPQVELLPGIRVPVESVRQHRDRHCTACREGMATYLVEGKRIICLCSCAIQRARRKIAAARQRLAAPPPPPARAAREDIQAHERVGRLGHQLQDLEAELEERRFRHESELAPLFAERGHEVIRHQDAATDALRARAAVRDLGETIKGLERQLETARIRLRSAEEGVADSVQMMATAAAEVARVDAAIAERNAAFEAGTGRLRKDIAKARRRLAGVRIRHPAADREVNVLLISGGM
jgi:hypothetical protein